MNYSPIQKAFDALSPIDRTQAMALAIRRNGQQHLHLIKKNDVGLVMDCRWLYNPDNKGAVHDHLASLEKIAAPVEPVGNGVITVDFDARKIISAQSHRPVDLFTADEFGYQEQVGPHWLNWGDVHKAAFDQDAIEGVRYDHIGGVFASRTHPLVGPARSSRTLALRTASAHKPYGFAFRGLQLGSPRFQCNK